MPAPDLAPLGGQQTSQHPRTGEGELQMQPVEATHDRKVGFRHRTWQVVDAATADVENTAAALVHELMEARDEKRLLRLQRQLAGYKLLIIDELGYVPLSETGAELLFEVFSQRYERGSTVVTSNLPFDEWTSVFSSERLTGALLDRLTHHVHILEMNGDSYRLNQSKRRSRRPSSDPPADNSTQT
jgi:hypothetical protein